MLSKEECLEALRDIEFNLPMSYINSEYGLFGRCAYVNQIEILKNLIYEHFNNPPLKLEEIRPDDWVWDKKNKEWRQVNFAGVVGKDDELMFYEDVFKKGVKIVAFKNFRSVVFEENRFYRKEVQE